MRRFPVSISKGSYAAATRPWCSQPRLRRGPGQKRQLVRARPCFIGHLGRPGNFSMCTELACQIFCALPLSITAGSGETAQRNKHISSRHMPGVHAHDLSPSSSTIPYMCCSFTEKALHCCRNCGACAHSRIHASSWSSAGEWQQALQTDLQIFRHDLRLVLVTHISAAFWDLEGLTAQQAFVDTSSCTASRCELHGTALPQMNV